MLDNGLENGKSYPQRVICISNPIGGEPQPPSDTLKGIPVSVYSSGRSLATVQIVWSAPGIPGISPTHSAVSSSQDAGV